MGLRSDRQYLTKIERDNGLRWDEIHAFRDRIQLPNLPRNFPPHLLPSNLCLPKMDQLEQCVQYGTEREHPKRPFERLIACKHHWINFERCIRKRDAAINKSVIKWETDFVNSMPFESAGFYQSELETKRRYFQYKSTGSNEIQAKFDEGRFFEFWDRIISLKLARGLGLTEDDKERQRSAKSKKVATLASVTRTITNKLLVLKSQASTAL